MRKKKFIKLYDKHVGSIYRFIYFKVNSQEQAQDLTSETFLKAWNHLKKAKHYKSYQALFYKIARNLVIDFYRKKSSKEVVLYDKIADTLPDRSRGLHEQAAISSDMQRVKSSLGKIRDKYREIVVLYYLDEMSIAEISEILDKSQGACRVLLHRGLEALRKTLK